MSLRSTPLVNPIQNQNPKIFPAANPKLAVHQADPAAPSIIRPDTFKQGEQPLGLPDPSKYPDWKPSAKTESAPAPEPTFLAATKETIMGGMDSPFFINGEVMTKREAIERGLMQA